MKEVGRDHHSIRFVQRSSNVRLGFLTIYAEYPFYVRDDGQASSLASVIGDVEDLYLHRVVGWNSHPQRRPDPVVRMIKDRIPRTMPDYVFTGVANGLRCRRPYFSGCFIANVDAFAGLITHRIVLPRTQPIKETAHRPGASRSRFARDESAIRICNDVDPWRRGKRVTVQSYLILAAFVESTQSVEIRELSSARAVW